MSTEPANAAPKTARITSIDALRGFVMFTMIFVTTDTATVWARARFSLLFALASAAGALLLNGLYGISKNNATPSWCRWSCAITAILWLGFYFLSDVCQSAKIISKPFSVAGQNVLLAYLLSENAAVAVWIHPF